jgi:iron complex outermembrane receptor protein
MLRWHVDGPSPLSIVLLATLVAAPSVAAGQDGSELATLSLEELGDVQVTSVSRRAQRLADAAASIYVISADAIRRAGVTRLPEALRLAPNLQVARVDASTYAITARGFNNALGNKLLVLVDGRTVYTPLFSGVFWDAQDVMLEDVERIEVISGPGATLWGANAVNGVINIITRRPGDTRGGLLALHGGGDGGSAALRYGGELGGGRVRAYARRHRVDSGEGPGGIGLADGWEATQAGFRAEWGSDERRATVQGDVYDGESVERFFGPVEVSGFNVLARWRDIDANGDGWRVQAYFDQSKRRDPLQFEDRMQVADIELVHSFTRGDHALIWGGGWRHARDEVHAGLITTFLPNRKSLDWYNLFVQDGIAFGERAELTLGLKLDHNDYTGAEWLPSVRFAWKAGENRLLWAALSRAVRTPSRIDREFFLPATPPFLIDGGPNFVSEVADVAELGLRGSGTRLQWSLTGFHAAYDRLRSGQPVGGGFQVENRSEGTVAGIEGWATWQVSSRWRLGGGGVRQWIHLRQKPGGLDPEGTTALGNDPEWQWQLRSSFDVAADHDFEVGVRAVGALPEPRIPSYTTVDVGWAWRPLPTLELRLTVDDVFDAGHVEFEPGLLSPPAEFGRSARLALDWRW